MTYGDNHVDRTSETLDGAADHETLDGAANHETLSYPPKQPAVSRLVDSFLKARVTSQDTDLLDDSFFSVVTFPLCFQLTPVAPQVASSLFISHISCR